MTYANITILGNVGRDPELRYTASGVAVTNLSIATSRRWKDQDDEPQEATTWWRVTCWQRQAETVAQYVKKGDKVLVVASQIEASAFEGRDGNPRASLEVTADRVVFLGSGGTPAAEDRQPDGDDIPF